MSRLWLPLLLACGAVLAVWAAATDSVTVDEPGHLLAGLSVLHTGDFRLAPEHPPLARLWAALPVYWGAHVWPDASAPGWREGNWWRLGPHVLGVLNDPDALMFRARLAIVMLYLALCGLVYGLARALCGRSCARLALLLAVFEPTLLAHGHYVTTDLALALGALLAIAACARLVARVTWGSLGLAALAIGALALTKFAWVAAVPALVAPALWALARREALVLALPPFTRRAGGERQLVGRGPRALVLSACALVLTVSTWAAVWAGYGWREAALTGPDREVAMMYPVSDFGRPQPATRAEAWEAVYNDPATGRPRSGLLPAALRFARAQHLLPEAYLFGFLSFDKKAHYRTGYLMGEFYQGARLAYFPVALVLKTPLGTLLLLLAGAVALALGRVSIAPEARGLAWGLATFAGVYAALALGARLNIGQRHLLPLYPLIAIVAGAASGFWRPRPQRGLAAAGALLLGLMAASVPVSTLAQAPHFLGYFNALAGGPEEGYRYLADSNIDWGQDLKRLARYAAAHPDERLRLFRFADTLLPRGFDPPLLWSDTPGQALAPLEAGTYVISVNELLGLYKPLLRASAWQDGALRARYAELAAGARFDSPQAAQSFDTLSRALLVVRLRERPPDARVGRGLVLWRLGAADLSALTRP